MMGRRRIASLTAALALLASGIFAANAGASFHLVKVSEVHEDAAGGLLGDYAELQMYAAGQNLLATHWIRFLNVNGDALAEYELPNVPSGENQRTVLIGNTGVAGADFANAGVNVEASGGVCWNTTNGGLGGIDCVVWGAFNGATPPSSPAGSPAAPAGLGAGQSLQRKLTPGCATLLEAGDDTNNSAADFVVGAPTPRNNSVAPTEKACTGAAKAKKCKKQKKGKGKSGAAAAKKKCKKKKKKQQQQQQQRKQ
jgi:hypothetical protein